MLTKEKYLKLYKQTNTVDIKVTLYQEIGQYFENFNKIIKEPMYGLVDFTLEEMHRPLRVKISYSKKEEYCIQEIDDQAALYSWYEKEKNGLLFLQGTPGSGKSMILDIFAANLVNKGHFAFLINLFDLSAASDESFMTRIKKYICRHYPFVKTALKFYGESDIMDLNLLNHSTLLFDGFDELGDVNESDNLRVFLRSLEDLSDNFRVILAGRTYLFEHCYKEIDFRKDITKLEILRLTTTYANEILKNFKRLFKSKIYFDIDDLEAIDYELTETPLLLFLNSYAKTQNNEIDITNIATLYNSIIKTTYLRDYKNISNSIDKEVLPLASTDEKDYANYLKTLEIIGINAFLSNTKEIPLKDCIKFADNLDFKQFHYWLDLEQPTKPYRLLMQFFLTGSNTRLFFFHKTFYEYLGNLFIVDFILNFQNKDIEIYRQKIMCLTSEDSKVLHRKLIMTLDTNNAFYKLIMESLSEHDKCIFSTNLSNIISSIIQMKHQRYSMVSNSPQKSLMKIIITFIYISLLLLIIDFKVIFDKTIIQLDETITCILRNFLVTTSKVWTKGAQCLIQDCEIVSSSICYICDEEENTPFKTTSGHDNSADETHLLIDLLRKENRCLMPGGIAITYTALTSCLISVINAKRIYLINTNATNVVFTVDAQECVYFENCTFDECDFRQLKCVEVRFSNCKFKECAFASQSLIDENIESTHSDFIHCYGYYNFTEYNLIDKETYDRYL